MRIHPQYTQALIFVSLALRLENRNADGMVSPKHNGHIGQCRHCLTDPLKILHLVADGDIAPVRDAYIAQPRPILAKGSQMCRPETEPFRAQRGAFTSAGGSIIGNANYCEIRISGCESWL